MFYFNVLQFIVQYDTTYNFTSTERVSSTTNRVRTEARFIRILCLNVYQTLLAVQSVSDCESVSQWQITVRVSCVFISVRG